MKLDDIKSSETLWKMGSGAAAFGVSALTLIQPIVLENIDSFINSF